MDTVTLVVNQVDDGAKLLAHLVQSDFSVIAACWVRTCEEGRWFFYIASDEVGSKRLSEAYREVYSAIESLPESGISMSEIKLIGRDNPMTRDLIDIQRRYPGKLPTRLRRCEFGGMAVDEMYLYAPAEPSFPGFDTISKRFPSAEIFSINVDREGVDAPTFVRNLADYRGKINLGEFEGKRPGTLWFGGVQTSSEVPSARLVFVHRPEGWNTLFRAETNSWEEVVQVGTGKKLYESVDFGPLTMLKRYNSK